MSLQTGTYQTGPISPDFRINNVSLTTPTSVQWILPKAWGIDGSGFERLEPFGSCIITWNYMAFNDYTALRDNWDLISGTATIKLPNIYGQPKAWVNFSGTVIDMPRPENPFFEGNHSSVKMVVRRVVISRIAGTP